MSTSIDLHMHSTFSDGSLSPEQIIDKAKQNGVKILSITDHDTLQAYSKELFDFATKKGITLISGVEISTKLNKAGIHVLGYNFNLDDKNFKCELKKLRESRHTYLLDVSKKLEEIGYVIQTEKLNEIDAVTKAHIALDVITNEKNKKLLEQSFGHIPTKGEFIESIMNEGCPAFVEKHSITPIEASNLIKNAGGKVVLAHPVVYQYEDGINLNQIKELISKMQPDGLESNYIYVNRENKIFDEIEIWNNVAKEFNLTSTIGSDFHISDGIRPEIGFSNFNTSINEDEIIKILKFLNVKKI